MKEMLEANVPIHFLTSCKISNASSSQTRDRISAKRAAESLWCYYSLLSHTSQHIHIKRVHKGIPLSGEFTEQCIEISCTRHCIL